MPSKNENPFLRPILRLKKKFESLQASAASEPERNPAPAEPPLPERAPSKVPDWLRNQDRFEYRGVRPLLKLTKTGIEWFRAMSVNVATGEALPVFIKHFTKVSTDSPEEAPIRLESVLQEIQVTVQFGMVGDLNFVQVIDVSEDETDPYLVFKEYRGRTLYDAILNDGTVDAQFPLFTEQDILGLIPRIGGALSTMHQADPPRYHQDVKPKNILLELGGLGTAVLADFDLAFPRFQFMIGSLKYLSSEAIRWYYLGDEPRAYDLAKRDIYAFAYTIYELLADNEGPYGAEQDSVLEPKKRIDESEIPAAIAKLKEFMKRRKYIPLASRRTIRLFTKAQLEAADLVIQKALEMFGPKYQYASMDEFVTAIISALRS